MQVTQDTGNVPYKVHVLVRTCLTLKFKKKQINKLTTTTNRGKGQRVRLKIHGRNPYYGLLLEYSK